MEPLSSREVLVQLILLLLLTRQQAAELVVYTEPRQPVPVDGGVILAPSWSVSRVDAAAPEAIPLEPLMVFQGPDGKIFLRQGQTPNQARNVLGFTYPWYITPIESLGRQLKQWGIKLPGRP